MPQQMRITTALEDLSYKFKQLRDNDNDFSLNGHGTPVNQAIKSLKVNIDNQLIFAILAPWDELLIFSSKSLFFFLGRYINEVIDIARVVVVDLISCLQV